MSTEFDRYNITNDRNVPFITPREFLHQLHNNNTPITAATSTTSSTAPVSNHKNDLRDLLNSKRRNNQTMNAVEDDPQGDQTPKRAKRGNEPFPPPSSNQHNHYNRANQHHQQHEQKEQEDKEDKVASEVCLRSHLQRLNNSILSEWMISFLLHDSLSSWGSRPLPRCIETLKRMRDDYEGRLRALVPFGRPLDAVDFARGRDALQLKFLRKLEDFFADWKRHFHSADSDESRLFSSLERNFNLLRVISKYIRVYELSECIGEAAASLYSPSARKRVVFQMTQDDIVREGLVGPDRVNALVSMIALLQCEEYISFPFKHLYDGSAHARMDALRRHEPHVDREKRFPHNVRFKSRDANGKFFLPFTLDGAFTTFVHSSNDYNAMDVVVDFFQEKQRMKAVRKDENMSPWRKWKSYDFNKSVTSQCLSKRKCISTFGLREEVYSQAKECTQFKPSLVVGVLKHLNCAGKRMLDFSAGWGDRLTGAIASNMECYHAFDPNTSLRVGHDAIKMAFLEKEKHSDFVVTYTGFEEARLERDFYDIVLTSPPFFDFEIYTKDTPGQSVDTYTRFEAWVVDFLVASIRKAFEALRVGGKCVIHITDVYKTKVCEPMCLLVLASVPCASYNGVMCSLGGVGRPRPLWVFTKTETSDQDMMSEAWYLLQSHFSDIAKYYEQRSQRQ
eukprot:m.9389 g.9389  ORF g.9389 m.9389 type:complete len:676 (+) comp6342_c0_seq2:165-2192(+)